MVRVSWNIPKIFEDLGGPTNVHARLALAELDGVPSVDAVRAWRRRGSIPSEWIAALVYLWPDVVSRWILIEDPEDEDIF